MNEQNNFDQNQNDQDVQDTGESVQDAFATEKRDQATSWYAAYYRDAGMTYMFEADEKARKKSRRRVGPVVLLVSLCIVFSILAGVASYLFMEGYRDDGGADRDENVNNTDFPNGENTNGLGGTVDSPVYEYDEEGELSYNYAAAYAAITKNDGAQLVGSPNGSAGSTPKSLIEATAAVKDSVVEITTTVVSNRGQITAGAGSGVIIHADGIIVTNNHVIEGSNKIYVRLTNGDTYEASLRGTDEDGDIAILKITPQQDKPLTVAKLGNSAALALGEEVIAIGNPLGELGGTVTNGIISATEREINVGGVTMTLLQTNAAINSGNSGGGLFNLAGELIGVVNAKYSASGVEGLGFAIPIDAAYEKSIKDLMEVSYIRGVPTIGVTLVEKTGTSGGFFGSTIYGAYVQDANGVSGIQKGDYIYSIDDTVVYGISSSAVSAVKTLVRSHKVGDRITVVVLRGEEKITLTVELKEYVP